MKIKDFCRFECSLYRYNLFSPGSAVSSFNRVAPVFEFDLKAEIKIELHCIEVVTINDHTQSLYPIVRKCRLYKVSEHRPASAPVPHALFYADDPGCRKRGIGGALKHAVCRNPAVLGHNKDLSVFADAVGYPSALNVNSGEDAVMEPFEFGKLCRFYR